MTLHLCPLLIFLKKIMEFSTKRRGGQILRFLTKKDIGSKHWELRNNNLLRQYYFYFFSGRLGSFHNNWAPQVSKFSCEAIWEVFSNLYHTEYISWHGPFIFLNWLSTIRSFSSKKPFSLLDKDSYPTFPYECPQCLAEHI